MNQDKPSINYGISANTITSDVIAVGENAHAEKNVHAQQMSDDRVAALLKNATATLEDLINDGIIKVDPSTNQEVKQLSKELMKPEHESKTVALSLKRITEGMKHTGSALTQLDNILGTAKKVLVSLGAL